MRKALTGTALLLSLLGTTAWAQSNGVPREFPPADFSGNQFVDSEGCAFIRAGISGNTQWVPRVDAGRRQLCNFQPTFAEVEPAVEEPEVEVAAAPAAPVETVDATPAPVEEPIAELPLITLPSDAERVASNRAVTVPVPRQTAPAPTPRVIAAAPTPAPEPVPEVEPAPAPGVPSVSLADVCEGKSGPQPGFISAQTGETIDCGDAPEVAEAPFPLPLPAQEPVAAAAPEPLRMTLAEICEAAKVGDRRFVDAITGQPIVCPSEVDVARAAPAPVAAPAPAPTPQVASNCPDIPAAPGQTVRCGPQTERPWTAAGSDGTTSTRARAIGLGKTPVPASNPAPTAQVATARVPNGYEQTWKDGRLNTRRGIPDGASAAPVGTTQVSTRNAPVSVASPYKYIQVGSFGVHSNADRLLSRLQGMGLGTATGRSGALKIVAVGPFTNAADMQRALGTVRSMGFPDAFPRN